MYTLNDTFNGRKLSAHRTVKAAVKAKLAHLAAVKRANSSSSYLWYSITRSDGNPVGCEETTQAAMELDNER